MTIRDQKDGPSLSDSLDSPTISVKPWKRAVKTYGLMKSMMAVVKKRQQEEAPCSRPSVSFSSSKPQTFYISKPQTFYILPRSAYTQGEWKACFYEPEDYERIVDKCWKLLQKNTTSKPGMKLCMRGLERMTESGMKIKNYNRSDAYHAVLDQQREFEHEYGRDCPELIAQLYHDVAQRCQKGAQRLAYSDAMQAARYYTS
jgi:hypothetical protein